MILSEATQFEMHKIALCPRKSETSFTEPAPVCIKITEAPVFARYSAAGQEGSPKAAAVPSGDFSSSPSGLPVPLKAVMSFQISAPAAKAAKTVKTEKTAKTAKAKTAAAPAKKKAPRKKKEAAHAAAPAEAPAAEAQPNTTQE